jgi:ketosteroid isomerase-like protein
MGAQVTAAQVARRGQGRLRRLRGAEARSDLSSGKWRASVLANGAAYRLQTGLCMKHNTVNDHKTSRQRALGFWVNLGLASVCLVSSGCSDDIAPAASDFPSTNLPAAYEPVAAYTAALNAHSFANAEQFATEDWNLINPKGVWSRGRDATVANLTQLEHGILKDATFQVERASISYASGEVALITMTSLAHDYVPDEALERVTFIVVKHADIWLLFQTQITTVSGEDSALSAQPLVEGSVPTDVGGAAELPETRAEKAHVSVAWFNGLPVTHDFDSAANFSTADWNLVPPNGYWTENRDATLASAKSAFTTFLDQLTWNEDALSAHFPTPDVAVLIQSRSYVQADQQYHELASFVVVDHDDHWLLSDIHITAVP